MVGLLMRLSRLINRKPNQTGIAPNTLIVKAAQKQASRAKHAERCFLGFGCARVGGFLFLPLKLHRNYPPPDTKSSPCAAPVPQSHYCMVSPLFSLPCAIRVGLHRRLLVQQRGSPPTAPALPRWPAVSSCTYQPPSPSVPCSSSQGG